MCEDITKAQALEVNQRKTIQRDKEERERGGAARVCVDRVYFLVGGLAEDKTQYKYKGGMG